MYSVEAVAYPVSHHLEKNNEYLTDDLSRQSASAAADAFNMKPSVQVNKSGSPIMLLQDYASDDSSENEVKSFHGDVNSLRISAPVLKSLEDTESHLETQSKSCKEHGIGEDGMRLGQSKSSDSTKAAEIFSDSQSKAKYTGMSSAVSGATHKNGSLVSNKGVFSHVALHKENAQDGDNAYVISKISESQKGDGEKKEKFEPGQPQLDEFGRLVREGSSDSDSDSRHIRRQHHKSRRRSRSQSPLDKRRKRRSWSKREKRSQSRRYLLDFIFMFSLVAQFLALDLLSWL